jgi:hypothetical protein
VNSTTLDGLLGENIALNITMIKIDIEGYEPIALSPEGSNRLFKDNPICHILTEISPWASKAADGEGSAFNYYQRLHSLGYTCATLGEKASPGNSESFRVIENSLTQFDLYCTRFNHKQQQICKSTQHNIKEGSAIQIQQGSKLLCPFNPKQVYKFMNGKRHPYSGFQSFMSDGKQFVDVIKVPCMEMLSIDEGSPVQ